MSAPPREQFLDDRLPSVDWDTLTLCVKQNLSSGIKELKIMVAGGVLDVEDIIVFPLDRAPGKVYKRNFSKNSLPCDRPPQKEGKKEVLQVFAPFSLSFFKQFFS